ncbi:MAG: cytochrome c1 [Gammaproteobacteria bacterium]|nr:cytochrome c1 [Gammaproteobacteria bacterium]
MKQYLFAAFVALALLGSASAAGGNYDLMSARSDLSNQASLQRGAKLFVNYCLSCHSASFMRYNRMAEDLGLTEEQLISNLMFASDKSGSTMTVAMNEKDANKWFGVVPPDLSVIARSRGPDWLYSYFMTFYRDDARPFGVNNLVFPSVGMPHVMERLQGVQRLRELKEDEVRSRDPKRELVLESEGSRSPGKFSKDMRDLTNFLIYVGEPVKLERYGLGIKVILFLLVLTFLTRALYKEYWKDVH